MPDMREIRAKSLKAHQAAAGLTKGRMFFFEKKN
jgi:hypothetical protein